MPPKVIYERKMELGIVFESEASHADLIRGACAEFIGMLMFLFGGEYDSSMVGWLI